MTSSNQNFSSMPTTPKRKYLVKRHNFSQNKAMQNKSIFINSIEHQNTILYTSRTTFQPFAKYSTLKTESANFQTLNTLEDSSCSTINKSRSGMTSPLPKLSMLKATAQLPSLQNNEEEVLVTKSKLKCIKQLSLHCSDPLHVKHYLNLQARVQKKYCGYKRIWAQKFMNRRKDKSLVERSLEKAEKHLNEVLLDARKRRNPSKLEDLVRDNYKEQTFIEPAAMRPEIQGLKGKGGLVKPIYEQIYIIEQVYKFDK